MGTDKYEQLYRLQDVAMERVFSRRLGFYLTGGTALSRFHLDHRYSDDLDFFTHEVNTFGDTVRLVRSDLDKRFDSVTSEIDARDFKRILVTEEGITLKIDFVGDRTPRVGFPEDHDGRYIDTVRNILSNKVGTVLSRDEARDVADLVQICLTFRFSWSEILQEAFEKQHFEREELVYRLSTFPVQMISTIPYRRSPPDLQEMESLIRTMGTDIKMATDNSLANTQAPNL